MHIAAGCGFAGGDLGIAATCGDGADMAGRGFADGDDVAVAAECDDLGAVAEADGGVAGTAGQHVVAVSSRDAVVVAAHGDAVVAGTGIDAGIADTAIDAVIAGTGVDHFVVATGGEAVVARTAGQHLAAGISVLGDGRAGRLRREGDAGRTIGREATAIGAIIHRVGEGDAGRDGDAVIGVVLGQRLAAVGGNGEGGAAAQRGGLPGQVGLAFDVEAGDVQDIAALDVVVIAQHVAQTGAAGRGGRLRRSRLQPCR